MSSIKNAFSQFFKPEFLRFVLVGGFAAAVNWISGLAFGIFTRFEIAIALAYLIGMTTAYVLNRLFVFERSGRTVGNEYLRFASVNIVALLQVWLVSVGLARFFFPAIGWSFHPEPIAHAIGVASPIITSYLGHRYFTYAKKVGENE